MARFVPRALGVLLLVGACADRERPPDEPQPDPDAPLPSANGAMDPRGRAADAAAPGPAAPDDGAAPARANDGAPPGADARAGSLDSSRDQRVIDSTASDGAPRAGSAYRLPWGCNLRYRCTQGFDGDICGSTNGDHKGLQRYAWDFGMPRRTTIRAVRAGRVSLVANVTGPGQACYNGCTQPFGTDAFWQCCNGCLNKANHVNVDHLDGTVSTYWHLDQVTVREGQMVAAGDVLGPAGTTGCSSGPHLHFQVMGNCPRGYCQSIAVKFDEAGTPRCGDNVTSRNACPP